MNILFLLLILFALPAYGRDPKIVTANRTVRNGGDSGSAVRNIRIEYDYDKDISGNNRVHRFDAEFINQLHQFGTFDMDLIITHVNGVIPPQRIPKNFVFTPSKPPVADEMENFLDDMIAVEIERIVKDWNVENPGR